MLSSFFRRRRARPVISRADAARDRRDWSAAAVLYAKALEIVPDHAGVWVQLGNMLKESGGYDRAEQAYAEALTVRPNDADTHLQIGHLLKLRGDVNAAALSYERALTLAPELSNAAFELRRLGRDDDVERILTKPRRGPALAETAGDPVAELRARLDSVAAQIPTFLEHVSTTKALAFELARVQIKQTEAEAGAAARTDHAEVKIAVLIDQFGVLHQSVDALGAGHAEHSAKLGQVAAEVKHLGHTLAENAVRQEHQTVALGGVQGRHGDAIEGFGERISTLERTMPDPAEAAHLRAAIDGAARREDLERELTVLRTLRNEFDRSATQYGETLRYLLERVEFVRRELLFEYRYAPRDAKFGGSLVAQPQILNPEKLATAKRRGKIVLNVGCGHIADPECLNVDRRALPGVDIVAEADALPFDPGEVSEIRSSHLIEHFPEEALVRGLLPHWQSLLKPGGRLRATVPDGETMLTEHAAGRYPFADLREVLYGGQDYEGDFHFNLLTPESLSAILTGAGFANVTLVEKGRRNGRCYEFETTAEKANSS